MFKKILLIFISLSLFVHANNENFTKDITKNLKANFYKFGVVYDEKSNKITFNETDMLFENNSTKIKKPFQFVLDSFFPKYLEILLKHKENIEKVIIKGHTSSINRMAKNLKEKYMLNKVLSQKRADEVLNYIKSIKHKLVESKSDWIKEKFESIGVSSSQLVYDKNNKEDANASRRIEIEIVFHNELKDILESSYIYTEENENIVYLANYIKRLLVESPTLTEKFNLLQSIGQDLEIAKAAFYPTATLNFSQTVYVQSEPANKVDSQSKDLTLKYNIFNGYKDLKEKKISQYNYTSNQYLKEQIENDLIYSLTEAFITIKKQKEILELAKINLEDYNIWLSKEDMKFQNGMTTLKDYSKVQARDTNQRINYEELTKQYDDGVSSFQRYLNFNQKDISSFEELNSNNKYLENKDIAYKDLKIRSPYVKEAQSIVSLYREKKDKSSVNFYPIVDLIAKKSALNESASTNETSIALEAKLEFYSGGKDQATYEKKIFEYRQKMQKKNQVLIDVKYKLDLAFNKYELTMKKEDLLLNLIAKREDSLLGSSYDYKFAKIDANGLLDAVDELYTAKKLYIENKYDKQLSEYKIISIIGSIKSFILKDLIKE
jgi:outer membrane protein TolC/outer membrane protein OmpA-like peptidoglycan-associated protein